MIVHPLISSPVRVISLRLTLTSVMGTKRNSNGEPVKGSYKRDETSGHWSQGLLTSLKDPSLKVLEDELVIIIKDKYPKALYHYLVCPKKEIPSLKAIGVDDLLLLKHMEKVGFDLAAKQGKQFLLGYHSVPSMTRLHLHVISDDFDSTCLKTKKHWNSFTTNFFIPSNKVITDLETNGKINFLKLEESKQLLNQPLHCHKCNFAPKNMPELKKHVKTHCN